MNSDPRESAAWRAFGMLDADETAAFDLAMRQDGELKNAYREMESLTAAVAAVTTAPITPRAGQLESLHLRLGIGAARRTNWLGISGWAAAAVLTAALLITHRPEAKHNLAGNEPSEVHPTTQLPTENIDSQPAELLTENTPTVDLITGETTSVDNPSSLQSMEPIQPLVRMETKRLIQEIEVLRGELENFQERDRERFQIVPDMAWPIVMRMTPPRSGKTLVIENEAPPLTAMLADALTAASSPVTDIATEGSIARNSTQATIAGGEPSAIPIYDAARDMGTLYVDNLPETAPDESLILWVTTAGKKQPVRVGTLPKSGHKKSESFDFNLGATATIPTEFILTRSLNGQANPPSVTNIILQGPSLK